MSPCIKYTLWEIPKKNNTKERTENPLKTSEIWNSVLSVCWIRWLSINSSDMGMYFGQKSVFWAYFCLYLDSSPQVLFEKPLFGWFLHRLNAQELLTYIDCSYLWLDYWKGKYIGHTGSTESSFKTWCTYCMHRNESR